MKYTLEWICFTKHILLMCAGYLRGMNIYKVTDSLVLIEMLRA